MFYYLKCNTQTCTQAELGHCVMQIFHDKEWRISLQTLLMKHPLHPGGLGLLIITLPFMFFLHWPLCHGPVMIFTGRGRLFLEFSLSLSFTHFAFFLLSCRFVHILSGLVGEIKCIFSFFFFSKRCWESVRFAIA